MIGMLGLLLAGCAFVPIDPTYPHERIRWMLEDTQPAAILISHLTHAQLPLSTASSLIFLDAPRSASSILEASPSHASLDGVAFVIFTSGSTGRPKASLNTHRALVNQAVDFGRQVQLTSADVVFQFSSISFDVSVLDFFVALCHGATLQLWHEGIWIDALMAANDVTYLEITPSALALIDPADCPKMRCVASTGETLPPHLALQWASSDVLLFNPYGPSECCVHTTNCAIHASDTMITIGKPMANLQVYILDEWMRPQPIGVAGELHVGGIGVSLGYLKRPELTAAKFLDSPFGPGTLYKSGDLARWRGDGSVIHMGRMDTQVKLRGQRVELGEIEHASLQLSSVKEAVAQVYQPSKEEQRLVLYVTPMSVDETALRSLLAISLPGFMIPQAIIRLEQMPKTSNGKLDRGRLPQPLADARSMLAPRTAEETEVRKVFASVLRIDVEAIGVEMSFFELGGNSLSVLKLARKMSDMLGRSVHASEIMQHPTVSALASARGSSNSSTLPPVRRRVERSQLRATAHPVSWNQSQLLTVHLVGGATAAYNIPMAWWLVGPLDSRALRAALSAVIERNMVLRTTYETDADGGFTQWVRCTPEGDRLLREVSVQSEEAAESLMATDASAEFELLGEGAGVMRSTLVRVNSARHLLLINVHHVAFDGLSTDVLLDELGALYRALSAGGTASDAALSDLPLQYVDYALWQRSNELAPVLETSCEYWRAQLHEGALPVLELPLDLPRPAQQTFKGDNVPVALSAETRASLEALGRTHGCTLYQVMLGLWSLLLCRHAGQEEVVVGSPYHGRDAAGTERLVGYFVNMLALRVDVPRDGSVAALLHSARTVAVDGMHHALVSFQQIVHQLLPHRTHDGSRNAVFQTMMAWEEVGGWASSADVFGSSVTVEAIPGGAGVAKVDVTLSARPVEAGGIEGVIEFNTDLFARESIERMGRRFTVLAEALAAAPAEAGVWTLPMMPADETELVLKTFNDTSAEYPADLCIHDLVAAQAARHPDAIALEWQGDTMTYGELMECAGQVARWLQAHGVVPDGVVALQLDRSLEQVVGVVGVLLSGGAFLPLDAKWPLERRQFMMKDAECLQLVAQSVHVAELSGWFSGSALALDNVRDIPWSATATQSNMSHLSEPSNLAYVMYTSGTTGKPKGVLVLHTSVVNLLHGHGIRYQCKSDRTWVCCVALNYVFDPYMWQLFNCIGTLGGHCVLWDNLMDLASSGRTGPDITHMGHVPSVLAQVCTALIKPTQVGWLTSWHDSPPC